MATFEKPKIDEFKRLPGLYRRWELNEVVAPDHNYTIEDAGAHADGTPLLAIFVSEGTRGATESASRDATSIDAAHREVR